LKDPITSIHETTKVTKTKVGQLHLIIGLNNNALQDFRLYGGRNISCHLMVSTPVPPFKKQNMDILVARINSIQRRFDWETFFALSHFERRSARLFNSASLTLLASEWRLLQAWRRRVRLFYLWLVWVGNTKGKAENVEGNISNA